MPPRCNDPEIFSATSDKAKLFDEIFPKNLNFDDSGSFYLFSSLKLI